MDSLNQWRTKYLRLVILNLLCKGQPAAGTYSIKFGFRAPGLTYYRAYALSVDNTVVYSEVKSVANE